LLNIESLNKDKSDYEHWIDDYINTGLVKEDTIKIEKLYNRFNINIVFRKFFCVMKGQYVYNTTVDNFIIVESDSYSYCEEIFVSLVDMVNIINFKQNS